MPKQPSKSELRYSNPFLNASVLNKGHFANFAKISCHGNVPKGIKNKCPNPENSRKYLSFAEKIMKIGPVDPEIALLMLKKKKMHGNA